VVSGFEAENILQYLLFSQTEDTRVLSTVFGKKSSSNDYRITFRKDAKASTQILNHT
jgi:hypothetical protein